ncbi:MAG: SecY-interacting protein Syd [Proteobacteria bacterium]|nr:SecY-interacting protein Syd [Pseudomonadota bacterium]
MAGSSGPTTRIRPVTTALTRLIESALAQTDEGCFTTPFDEDWRSAAELDRFIEGQSCWRPVRQSDPVDFSGLANALEQPIHPDIIDYYGSFWSGTIETESAEGQVSLIQLWNPDDFDRLIENLIGHALMKRRQKQPFTTFFANTGADSQLFLSVDNQTGQVLLEEPGKPPLRAVQDNLANFLNRLTPRLKAPDIY